MDFDDLNQNEIEDMISKLEINIDNIYHLILSNGMEMMGELFPSEQLIENADSNTQDDIMEFVEEENNLLFLNPIRIHRTLLVDDEGEMKTNNYFTEWNPHIDGPFTHISKVSITAMNKPNESSLVYYLQSIYHIYYPILDEIPDGNLNMLGDILPLKERVSIPKNIISFEDYHSKRINGRF